MESYDPNIQRRVWERVSGGSETDDLTPLMAQELTDAATLTRLAKVVGGRGGDLLRLARECRQRAGYLRGIRAMTQGSCPDPAVPTPPVNTPGAALRRCYVNFLCRLRFYELRSPDPEYGPVYQQMTDSLRSQCATLLDLIGKVER